MSHIFEAIDVLHTIAFRAETDYNPRGDADLDICNFCHGVDNYHDNADCPGQRIMDAIAVLDDCNAECTCPKEETND